MGEQLGLIFLRDGFGRGDGGCRSDGSKTWDYYEKVEKVDLKEGLVGRWELTF